MYIETKQAKGMLNLVDGLVDITDPCYDEDAYCRENNVKVKPGMYNCHAGICVKSSDEFEKGRCFFATIVHEDYKYTDIPVRSWKKLCDIGVDAGLAGFFSHKPDFNDDVWNVFCNKIYKGTYWLMHDLCEGFFTSSGYGDGYYPVYAYYRKNEIVALQIRFY